jgi:hypothetical protein
MDVRNLRNQHGLAFVRAQTETAETPLIRGLLGSTIAQFFARLAFSPRKRPFQILNKITANLFLFLII